jgi:nicotinamidase-related amidase
MKILLVVDMQNDFITGSLGSKEAEAIVGNVKEKIEEYKKNGDLIWYTMDTHDENYLNTLEGKGLPVPHCIKDTDGWKICDALGVDYENDFIILKKIFGVIYLDECLIDACEKFYERKISEHPDEDISDESMRVQSIEIVGLCTDICVVSNALIAKSTFDVPVIVDASCCAGVTPEKHKAAIEVMKSCQINVINE